MPGLLAKGFQFDVNSRQVDSDFTGLLARNTILNLAGQGLPLLVAVVAMPVAIRGLGSDRFGILALAWAILGYFTTFDLGLSRAATKFVAAALGQGNHDEVRETAWTVLKVQSVLGIVGGVLLAAATPMLVEQILEIPQDLHQEARTSFYFLAFSVPPALFGSALQGLLEAAQRFDLINLVRAPLKVSVFLIPIVGVLLGWKLPPIVVALVAVRVAATAFYYVFALREIPAFHRVPRFHLARFKRLLSFGGWVTVSSVLAPILVYLDRFLIGSILSVTAVTYYAAPYEAVTRLWVVPAAFVGTLFPAFSALHAQRRARESLALLLRCTKYLLLLVGPMVAGIIVFSPVILDIWLGTEFMERSTAVLQILAFGVLVNSLARIPHAMTQAVDRPDVAAKLHALEVPVHVLVLWLLVTEWGILGAAIAWSLRVVVDALLLFGAAFHLSPVPVRQIGLHRVPHTVGILTAFFASLMAVERTIPSLWMQLTTVGMLVTVLCIGVWHWLLSSNDRDLTRQLLAYVVHR